MEINDDIINDLAEELRAGKMGEYQLKIQEMNIQINKIIKEIAENNPEASREEVLKMANDKVTELVAQREANMESQTQENEEARD